MDQDAHDSYAVLMPVLKKTKSVLFEVRSNKLLRQPNEICFPGGKIESGETPQQSAVRELSEELMVSPDKVEVVAPLDILVKQDVSIIYPFIGYLSDYQGTFDSREVEETFLVPLEFFLKNEPLVYTTEISVKPGPGFPHHLIGTENYPWHKGESPVLFYLYEDKVIWGLTARIVLNAVKLYLG
jgi:8-oxo-dGTP pyrophosphatase MutT (NUDIX family)